MSTQLAHEEIRFKEKQFPIVLLLDHITGEANIGSLFRLADAFGIERIIFCGTRPNLDSNRLKRTARNTHHTVKFEFSEEITDVVKKLKTEGYKMLALEITSDSLPISEFRLSSEDRIALIAGNERHGVSSNLLTLCDQVAHIEMFGKNSSMNVAQSTGIALYELTKALNKFGKK